MEADSLPGFHEFSPSMQLADVRCLPAAWHMWKVVTYVRTRRFAEEADSYSTVWQCRREPGGQRSTCSGVSSDLELSNVGHLCTALFLGSEIMLYMLFIA